MAYIPRTPIDAGISPQYPTVVGGFSGCRRLLRDGNSEELECLDL
jgi:hypothetical protein